MEGETFMSKTVGIIGLGIMGSAIAPNLIERGWQVVGFDIDAERCAEMAKAGVVIAKDVAEVARDTPIIMTSLPTPKAVGEVARSIAERDPNPRVRAWARYALEQRDAVGLRGILHP